MSHASPSRAARRTPMSVLAASQIGGRGPLQRWHRDPHLAQLEVLALIVDRLAAPQSLQGLQPLHEAADSLAGVHPHRLVLGVAIAKTEAHDQPPAADHVERGELLGEIDRLVQRQQQHAGAEHHALGLGRHACQRRQRLEVRERLGEIVLARPDGRKSDSASQAHLLDVLGEARGLRVLRAVLDREREAESHGVGGIYAAVTLPSSRRGAGGLTVVERPACR
jgi:hypothetical protein